MGRRKRFETVGIAQLIVQRGHNRQPVFLDDSDREFYRQCLRESAYAHGCQIHAYVLMPDHVHILVTPTRALAVSRFMQSTSSRYVWHVNRKYDRTGSWWDGRFKATLVAESEYVLRCYRYVEGNPVRATLANAAIDYPWSSARSNALGASDDSIVNHEAYVALGRSREDRLNAYNALLSIQPPPEQLREIRESISGSRALASKESVAELEAVLARSLSQAKRGRPRKRLGQPVVPCFQR